MQFCMYLFKAKLTPKVIAGLTSHFKNVDKKMAEAILNEVIDGGPVVSFSDIGKCSQPDSPVYYIINCWFENLHLLQTLNKHMT